MSRVQRQQEWAHGGDRIKVDADVALADQKTFEDVVVQRGVPAGKANRSVDADQSVVVQVRWSGVAGAGGWFQLIALDARTRPPRPLAADGGWNSDGATGANWAGAYGTLAEHYDWLQGVAESAFTGVQGMSVFPAAAVDAPALTSGTVTAWFRQWGAGRTPFDDATRDIVVALVYVDVSGRVRWARRIFG